MTLRGEHHQHKIMNVAMSMCPREYQTEAGLHPDCIQSWATVGNHSAPMRLSNRVNDTDDNAQLQAMLREQDAIICTQCLEQSRYTSNDPSPLSS